MDRDRHQRLMEQFDELADLSKDERARRLEALRAEDAELADGLERMLEADARGEELGPGLTPTAVLRGLKAAVQAQAPERDAERPPPERIGHYRVLRKLGAGGMGEVYAAVDERLGRKVAIKLLPEGTEWRTESRLRMVREAQAASALNHPGIVTLYDVEAHEGRLCLVMEHVEGESFFDLAERGVLPAEALRLTAEAADALAAAHAAGVMHRDIKSENLMRTAAGRVKVLDFGVAKIVGEAMRTRSSKVWELAAPRTSKVWEIARPPGGDRGGAGEHKPPAPLQTQAGVVVGTPSYLAPELLDGEPPSLRTEVFSLGVVLYELLCGSRPFSRGELARTLAAVRECKPVPPSQRAADRKPFVAAADVAAAVIDERVDALVLRALARSPADRFADMPQLAAAIRALAAPAAPSRRRWIGPAAAGAAIAAAALAYGLTRGDGEPPPALSGSARRLTFDPGCEEFPSFTPDGKTLVYDALVDGDTELLAHDLAGGARRRLTRSPGWDYGAAVSPSGAEVAFVHQGDASTVRVMRLDGPADTEPAILGRSDGYPVWSPRGTVLFGEGDRVREWDHAAGTRDLIVLPAQRRALYLAPYADGRVAAVLGTAEQEVAPALALLDGSQLETLPISDAAEYPIAASPSGKGLYYQRNGAAGLELLRVPRAGGKAEVLEGGVTAPGSLVFAPGGRQLAYSTCRSSSFVARIASGRVEPLTRAGGWTDGYPVPLDAGHLLFTSDRAGRSQIWRLDVATGAAEAVTPGGTLRATVAPEGRHVAWAVLDPPGIVVADLDAAGVPGPPRRLTDRRGDTGPQFTHDGARLLFVRLDDTGGDRVWVVPTGGGPPSPLAPVGTAIASASPAGDQLVYLVTRGAAGVDVVATDLAGTPPVVLTTLPAGAFRSLRHSPDGKRLLLIREEQEILELDLTRSPPPLTSLWRGGVESVTAAAYAPDGAAVLASVVAWEGDIWIVDGRF